MSLYHITLQFLFSGTKRPEPAPLGTKWAPCRKGWSADLNLTEYLWDELEHHLCTKPSSQTSVPNVLWLNRHKFPLSMLAESLLRRHRRATIFIFTARGFGMGSWMNRCPHNLQDDQRYKGTMCTFHARIHTTCKNNYGTNSGWRKLQFDSHFWEWGSVW